jgi:hypothetical protein
MLSISSVKQGDFRDLLKVKLIATAVHLSMSVAVFLVLAYLIYYVWYPQPFYSIAGGWQGMRLVAAVDLILGPVITFLIFNLNKSRREIVFDLVIILVIQFGALAYGVVATYSQRPVAVILIWEDMISATKGDFGDTLESTSALAEFSDEQPPIIASSITGAEGLNKALAIKEKTGIHGHVQMQWYLPAGEFKSTLVQRQKGIKDRLKAQGAEDRFATWLEQNQKTADDVHLGFFNGRYGTAWLVFDREARYLGYFW